MRPKYVKNVLVISNNDLLTKLISSKLVSKRYYHLPFWDFGTLLSFRFRSLLFHDRFYKVLENISVLYDSYIFHFFVIHQETGELQKKQTWYQENQMNLTKEDEEDYLNFCSEAMFRIHILELRLNRFVEMFFLCFLKFSFIYCCYIKNNLINLINTFGILSVIFLPLLRINLQMSFMELVVISNFHYWRPHWKIELDFFRSHKTVSSIFLINFLPYFFSWLIDRVC